MFTRIVNVLFGTRYTDVLVGFRAYRRKAALRLGFDAPGLSWPCQSSIRFARAGLRVTEIPAHEPARIGGKRKMMPFKTGLEITRLILRDFFTFRPGQGRSDVASPPAAVMNKPAARPYKMLQRCKICGSHGADRRHPHRAAVPFADVHAQQ